MKHQLGNSIAGFNRKVSWTVIRKNYTDFAVEIRINYANPLRNVDVMLQRKSGPRSDDRD